MKRLLIPSVRKLLSRELESGSKVGKRFETGGCGIPPHVVKHEVKFVPPPSFPQHLIRPPCTPEQSSAAFRDCGGMAGYYCPPEKLKYKYPPFSENIDFIPSGQTECWWVTPKSCDWAVADEEDNIPVLMWRFRQISSIPWRMCSFILNTVVSGWGMRMSLFYISHFDIKVLLYSFCLNFTVHSFYIE